MTWQRRLPPQDPWRAMDTQLLFDADDRPGEGPSEAVGEPVADLVCDSPPFSAPLYAGAWPQALRVHARLPR